MDVKAPFACSVWQHSVSVSQRVSAGDCLMTIESMKMEVPIEAPCAGIVTFLRAMNEPVEEGGTVATIDAVD